LITKILGYDQRICSERKIFKEYQKDSISNATLSRFLKKFGLETINKKKAKNPTDRRAKKSFSKDLRQQSSIAEEDDEMMSTTSTKAFTVRTCPQKFNILDQVLHSDDEGSECSSETSLPLPQACKDDELLCLLEAKEGKIKELTEICAGLSNKIVPSTLILDRSSGWDSGLEGKRPLHLCIRALIQVLSPVKPITEWIIENDFLILSQSSIVCTVEEDKKDPFHQLANTWFWDGILKYEALEKESKIEILNRFEQNIKDLCITNDIVFGTVTEINHPRLQFIPPPPQKILDMIIQQHYNHFLDYECFPLLPTNKRGELYEGAPELPNLPFRKIQLIPPSNAKPFSQVSFCSWRPRLATILSPRALFIASDDESEPEPEAEILLAELSWDREKQIYIKFVWPQYDQDVILEKGWSYYDSQGRLKSVSS
jgi:hypothetical protein